ncbi:hypothetical protein ACOSQ3_017135 [Xanthoceras sorbifolium]
MKDLGISIGYLILNIIGVTWEAFDGLFCDNYFNAGHRRMLADMFENIEQGEMTEGPTSHRYCQKFMKLTDCLAAAILAETNFKDIQPLKNQPSGSRDRKMTKKNQGGWRGPNYATSRSGTSSGPSGRSSPYGNCYNCGQQDHLKKACPYLRRSQSSRG